MNQATIDAQLVGVFPQRPDGSGSHLATVSFAFRHEGMMPLKFFREYMERDKKTGEPILRDGRKSYKSFELGEVEGSCLVRVRGAKLYAGNNGPFLKVDGIAVPYDVKKFVAELADAELTRRANERKGA